MRKIRARSARRSGVFCRSTEVKMATERGGTPFGIFETGSGRKLSRHRRRRDFLAVSFIDIPARERFGVLTPKDPNKMGLKQTPRRHAAKKMLERQPFSPSLASWRLGVQILLLGVLLMVLRRHR